MSEDKKTCFIIMPITTPEFALPQYQGDTEHFNHVLQCLLIPAIEQSGFKPILPKVEGSHLIHSEIVSNLEASDLVLCDMSCLNANVFFELGIRTALNRLVCLVRDEKTTQIPFDTTIINHLTYGSSMHSWETEAEIEKLVKHIRATGAKGATDNPLWRHFGLTAPAKPYEAKGGTQGVEETLRAMSLQIENLSAKLSAESYRGSTSLDDGLRAAVFEVQALLDMHKLRSRVNSRDSERITLVTNNPVPPELMARIRMRLEEMGLPPSAIQIVGYTSF